MSDNKPKYPLCWFCNRKFHGRHHTTVQTPSGDVLVHKACAEEMKR